MGRWALASELEVNDLLRAGEGRFVAQGFGRALDYAEAKTAYFKALREEMPELMYIATGREARPPELDTFAAAFAVAGEKQEMAADQKTLILLKRFSRNPDIEKARVKFDRAQKVEESFHKDFDGLDFTMSAVIFLPLEIASAFG